MIVLKAVIKAAAVAFVIAVAVAVIIALGGCGEQKLDHGTVVAKVHEPAHDYVYFVPVCTTTGGQYPTTHCIPIPYFVHDGEDWKLELNADGKNGYDYVDRETWERTPIGAHVDKATTADGNNQRRKQ